MRPIALTLILLVTLLSGLMQGTLHRRWGTREAEKVAAIRLLQFPTTLGTWTTVGESQLDETSLKMLEPSGHLVRMLTSSVTRTPVSMTLLLGPTGFIGAHTPEVCVSGIGYEQLGPAEKITVSVPGRAELEGSFWVATFRSKNNDRHLLREYWAWSTGGPWQAADNSRLGFGFYPYLYKVQLGCQLAAASDPDLSDPTPDLLQQLVAVSPNYLVNPPERYPSQMRFFSTTR